MKVMDTGYFVKGVGGKVDVINMSRICDNVEYTTA